MSSEQIGAFLRLTEHSGNFFLSKFANVDLTIFSTVNTSFFMKSNAESVSVEGDIGQ